MPRPDVDSFLRCEGEDDLFTPAMNIWLSNAGNEPFFSALLNPLPERMRKP
jgi:hypothetical protein